MRFPSQKNTAAAPREIHEIGCCLALAPNSPRNTNCRRIMEDYFRYDILFQINITDVDDKIILKAR